MSSHIDPAIPQNIKDYVKAMFKELLSRLVSIAVITQAQADAGYNIIDSKYS